MVVLSGELSVYDSPPAKGYVILDGALIDSGDAKSRALTNNGIQPIIYRIMCGVLGERPASMQDGRKIGLVFRIFRPKTLRNTRRSADKQRAQEGTDETVWRK